MTKYNLPGNPNYEPSYPLDPDIRSILDQELRGYWLARDAEDLQICLVSNQNEADHLRLGEDPDGFSYVLWTDETREFSYSAVESCIRVKRYA